MKHCSYAGKKRAKHLVVIKKGKKTIRFKASSGCAPRTKAQRSIAKAAHACKAKGIRARGSGRRGFTKEWRRCIKREA